MSGPVENAAAQAVDNADKPNEPNKSLQWITYSVTKSALNNQLGKQKKELEKLKVSHGFVKHLNELRAIVKPDGDNNLVIGSSLREKLDDIKNYAAKLKQDLQRRDLPDAVKSELIDRAKALCKRAEKVVEDVEKDNLDPTKRKDVREDLDNAIKEISEDNSMQLNMVTRIMNNLHEMYAMARSIIRTAHEMMKNFIRNMNQR